VKPWCAVLLAAGEGTRLRPLTELRPKPLCPVGNVPLLERALEVAARLGRSGPAQVAVNASWLGEQIEEYVDGRAHISWERDGPLGTAGALGRLRDWIDGRGVLVVNTDAYLAGGRLTALTAGWDGETARLLGVPGDPRNPETFSGHRFAGLSLLPWRWVRDLPPHRHDLVRAVWRPAEAAGELEVVTFEGYFTDTGTPGGYLAANLHAAGGGNLVAPGAVVSGQCVHSVIGADAVVAGTVVRSVVWPSARVSASERLIDAIRADGDVTVPTAGRCAEDQRSNPRR